MVGILLSFPFWKFYPYFAGCFSNLFVPLEGTNVQGAHPPPGGEFPCAATLLETRFLGAKHMEKAGLVHPKMVV